MVGLTGKPYLSQFPPPTAGRVLGLPFLPARWPGRLWDLRALVGDKETGQALRRRESGGERGQNGEGKRGGGDLLV